MKVGVLCVLLVATAAASEGPTAKTAAKVAAQDAAAIFREYVDAWNRHDPEALDALLDGNSVHENIPAGFRGKGAAEIKAFLAEVPKAQPDLKWRLTRVIASGTKVAAEWTWTSTLQGKVLMILS